MAASNSAKASPAQLRATALRHAESIEEKKRLRARITDLVLETFELPSSSSADPSHPTAADAALFKQALMLFQPSDFDDLVYERNVDDRCGFALCPRPNAKVRGGGEVVWNRQGGKNFKLVAKAELERWCSPGCGERAMFVRAQLGTEPAWLRETPVERIEFLDQVKARRQGRPTSIDQSVEEVTLASRLSELSLERGELQVHHADQNESIAEKSKADHEATTPVPDPRGSDLVEAYQTQNARSRETEDDPMEL